MHQITGRIFNGSTEHIFVEIIATDIDKISEKVILEILKLFNNYNLLIFFYLITVVNHLYVHLIVKMIYLSFYSRNY